MVNDHNLSILFIHIMQCEMKGNNKKKNTHTYSGYFRHSLPAAFCWLFRIFFFCVLLYSKLYSTEINFLSIHLRILEVCYRIFFYPFSLSLSLSLHDVSFRIIHSCNLFIVVLSDSYTRFSFIAHNLTALFFRHSHSPVQCWKFVTIHFSKLVVKCV